MCDADIFKSVAKYKIINCVAAVEKSYSQNWPKMLSQDKLRIMYGYKIQKTALRIILRWIVPILLLASCYGWIWPPGWIQEGMINPVLRITCQIIGLICSLLLGLWWMLVFSHVIWNFWSRASFGMFGMCLAGYVLIGMGLENIYVYCGCGGLQVIWFISVMWYQSWNKILIRQKELEGHLLKEMVSLFGHRYVMLLRWLKQMCGFCFFAFLTSLGWFIATVGSAEYSNTHVCMKTGTIISLGLFAILLPWVSLLSETTSVLITKSVNQGIKGTVLGCCFIGFCIYYLVFCYMVAVLGCAKKDDPISWPFGLLVLGILIFGIVVYRYWYKYALKLEEKIASSDSYEQIRRKCLDYHNALKDIRFPRYNKEVTSTFQGLTFRDIHGEKLYHWDKIRNIFFDSLNIVSVVDKEGNKSEGKMPSPKKIKPNAKIEAIWSQWADHIARKEEIIKFEYPIEEQKKDENTAFFEALFAIVLGVGLPIMHILMWEREIGIFIPAFVLLISLTFVIWGILRLKSKPKVLSSISIEQDRILVHYTSGEIQECMKSGITDSTFKYYRTGVLITFKGLPYLKKIERVSYFPVLRQKLLEIIQTEQRAL